MDIPKPHTAGTVKVSEGCATGPIDLYYELHGKGPNKLLLITGASMLIDDVSFQLPPDLGLSASCRSWDSSLTNLLPTGDYEICVLDNRGVGNSTHSPKGYSIKDMAKDTLDLLLFLDWTKNVFLAGISMGGMIALELVLAAPQGTFAAVALVSTTAGGTLPPFRAIWNHLFGPDQSTLPPEKNALAIADTLFPKEWHDKTPQQPGMAEKYKTNLEFFVANQLRNTGKKPQTPEARAGQIQAISNHLVSKERLAAIGRLGIPVKVFVGTTDNLVRTSNSKYLGKHIPAPIQVLDGVGHAPPIQDYLRFHSYLVELFKSSPAFVRAT
ncbi:hypothetical protein HDU83_005313 [Entophlyctis luteolus]|nr:hypothetical protein HDU83_005313 [Entophlyctis luteolus]KAJ3381915.1 hypothetical protein HDU84_004753 [Entophlyctis sp. JEL0112]